jgi:hypothetical protein
MDIVFVSSDRDEASFSEYLATMPWKALPLKDRRAKEELSALYGVEGIPTLVFVHKDGRVLTTDGRSKVASSPEGFPWPPQPVDALETATEYINDEPVAVLWTDTATDAANEARAVEAFAAVAREYFVDGRPSPAIRFAHAAEGDGAIESVRKFLGPAHMKDKDGPAAVRVTIVNVPEGVKANLLPDGEALRVPTEDELRAFVRSFVDGQAKMVPIKA